MLDASVNVMGIAERDGVLREGPASARSSTRRRVEPSTGNPASCRSRRRPTARPVSPYGISKKVVIDYLGFYERYHGIAFTALALANVYGPRQDPTARPAWSRSSRRGCLQGRRRRSSVTAIRRGTTSSWMTSSTPSLSRRRRGRRTSRQRRYRPRDIRERAVQDAAEITGFSGQRRPRSGAAREIFVAASWTSSSRLTSWVAPWTHSGGRSGGDGRVHEGPVVTCSTAVTAYVQPGGPGSAPAGPRSEQAEGAR